MFSYVQSTSKSTVFALYDFINIYLARFVLSILRRSGIIRAMVRYQNSFVANTQKNAFGMLGSDKNSDWVVTGRISGHRYCSEMTVHQLPRASVVPLSFHPVPSLPIPEVRFPCLDTNEAPSKSMLVTPTARPLPLIGVIQLPTKLINAIQSAARSHESA